MDKEEKLKKEDPAVPPNYVSIAQLQERWLQRKKQEEERQKAQAESKNQDNLKPTKGSSETPQNSNNREPRIGGHRVSDHRVRSRSKGKEFDGFVGDNGMDKSVNGREIGVHGVEKGRKGGGKEHGSGKIKGEKDCSQTQGKNLSCNAGVEGTASVFMVEAVCESVSKEIKPVELIRKSDGKMVKDRENSRKNGHWRFKRSGRTSKVEELPENAMRKEDLGVLRSKNAPINGDDDDCMVEVSLENKVKEGALLGSGLSKGSEIFGGEVERKWKKKIEAKKLSDSKDKNTRVAAMEKGMEDEILTGYNGSSLQKRRRGGKARGYRHKESVTLVEAMEKGIEDEVLTGCNGKSVQKGRGGRNVQGYAHRESVTVVDAMEKGMEDEVLTGCNGSSVQKGRGGRNVQGYAHRESVTVVDAMDKGMEDEGLTSYNGSSVQKGRGGRKVQGYRHRESVSEDLETRITENFTGMSFVDSKKSNVTSRMGGRGNYKRYSRYPVMHKPADNTCVWVKKGEISATNVAEIDNSGPAKLESTGFAEDEREKEAKN